MPIFMHGTLRMTSTDTCLLSWFVASQCFFLCLSCWRSSRWWAGESQIRQMYISPPEWNQQTGLMQLQLRSKFLEPKKKNIACQTVCNGMIWSRFELLKKKKPKRVTHMRFLEEAELQQKHWPTVTRDLSRSETKQDLPLMERDVPLWEETDPGAAVKTKEQTFSPDERQDGKTLYLILAGSGEFMWH